MMRVVLGGPEKHSLEERLTHMHIVRYYQAMADIVSSKFVLFQILSIQQMGHIAIV